MRPAQGWGWEVQVDRMPGLTDSPPVTAEPLSCPLWASYSVYEQHGVSQGDR